MDAAITPGRPLDLVELPITFLTSDFVHFELDFSKPEVPSRLRNPKDVEDIWRQQLDYLVEHEHGGCLCHLLVEPLRLPADERVWAEVACVLAEALTGAKQARRGLWMEFGTLSQSRRGPHISEFSSSPLLPDKHLPQEVDARVLRLVRPAEILTRARVELEIANDLVARGYVTVTTAERQELEQLVAAWDGPSQSKPRRRREPRFYELVARKYLELQDRGIRRGRLGQIAVELGLDPKTEPMSEHVRYCRETLGYLNRHGQRGPSLGRAGAQSPRSIRAAGAPRSATEGGP